MGTLLHSCVEIHEPIVLLFGVVSRVGPGIGVDGGQRARKGRGGFVRFQTPLASVGFSGIIVEQKCIRLVHEKLIIFNSCVKN